MPPRRVANGIDRNRLAMMLAVLARHGGPSLAGAPTSSSTSPAASGSTSRAPTWRSRSRSPPPTAASRSPTPTASPLACFGEVGLTGELRYVAHADRRVAEALKFGLAPVLGPGRARERLDGLRLRGDAARGPAARRSGRRADGATRTPDARKPA